MRKECSEPIGAGRPHHDNLEVMTVKMKGTHDALTGESILRGAVGDSDHILGNETSWHRNKGECTCTPREHTPYSKGN